MSKKSRAARRREHQEQQQQEQQLKPETKKSMLAVLFIGLAVVLVLANFDKAGPAGRFVYQTLTSLLGWGYYLVPFILILIAVLFLISHQRKFVGLTFLGAGLFIISGLGIIDIASAGNGGWLGNVIGLLQVPFGRIAAMILAVSFVLASLLLTLNASIRLRFRKEKPAEKQEELDLNITEPPEAPIEDASARGGSALRGEKQKNAKADSDEGGEEEKEDQEEWPVTATLPMPTRKAIRLVRPVTQSLPAGEAGKNYVAPPLSLLKSSVEKPTAGDLRANANIIKRTLEGFGISVEMSEINIGPKVTRYTLKPAEGVKLSRIIALNPDLALALAAHPIRIEAPIPGKSLVGIEVPNKSAAIVRLGSLLAYPEFTNSGPLATILGRDVTGDPIVADIERMPHMLVAGSTGSGKSVAIHSLLISLLYKNSPETLRLILIDPKRVELSVYGSIPHLVTPVITDGKKVIGALRRTIQEMERRYETLLDAGARDIKSYNKNNAPALPYLLLIIDELADLMAAYGREIENSVVRLAQMARATGIHLLVSTQRPSVEVITGLIKANITSRVALQVASQVDSRTILDMAGAEKLLGGGDMLFISSDFSKPKRIQGAYISEEEIHEVTDFIRANNEPTPTTSDEEQANFNGQQPDFTEISGNGDDDELLEESIRVVREAGKASASLLQRRLKVGYARAARLLDIMEAKGIVGPGDGAKPREVYGAETKSDNFDEGFGSENR